MRRDSSASSVAIERGILYPIAYSPIASVVEPRQPIGPTTNDIKAPLISKLFPITQTPVSIAANVATVTGSVSSDYSDETPSTPYTPPTSVTPPGTVSTANTTPAAAPSAPMHLGI